MSDDQFGNKIIMVYLLPLSTLPSPQSVKLRTQLRLVGAEHLECRHDKLIILLQFLLFSLSLSASTLPCCTEPVTVMIQHLRRQQENWYYTVLETGLIISRHVRVRPSPVSKNRVHFFSRYNLTKVNFPRPSTHLVS